MSGFAGSYAEDMDGKELSRVIVDYWKIRAGSTVFIDELTHACGAMEITSDCVVNFIDIVNDYRGYDRAESVLTHAFVPDGNIRAICDLLDEIQALCVGM